MYRRIPHLQGTLCFWLLSFLLVTLLTSIVWGQQAGSADLTGTVFDSTGAVIPGVTLTATNMSTNVGVTTTSNQQGDFVFKFLPSGRYNVTAKMDGFQTLTVSNIVIQVSINITRNITMKPGAVSQTVTVTAEPNTVETDNATVTRSITNEQMRGLPVFTSSVGRTVLDQLAFLLPGVTPGSTGAGTRGEYININGSRDSSIAYNFDGGDNNDLEMGRAASTLPNPDVLQEFTVVANNYSADQGRSSGGIINAVTKSGTNSYHGNLRYFLINEALDARCFFCDVVPRDRLNTFGGQIGGPLRVPKIYNGTDRTQFFFDYEGTRARNANLFNRDLFTAKERAGDFSNLAPSLWPIDPVTKKPFPNGIIPADRFSPIAKKYIDQFIPLPNNGDRNYRTYMPYTQQNDQYTVRIDHELSARDTIGGTYFLTKTSSLTASTTNLPIGSEQDGITTNHNLVLRETHTFSSRLSNQFTGTVTRYNDAFIFHSAGVDGVTPSSYGFTGVHPQSDAFIGLPSIVVSGTGIQITSGTGNKSFKTTWQIKDDMSYTVGKHAFKFGVELRSFIFNKKLANNNGSFSFSSGNPFGTKNSYADFLVGLPNSYYQSSGTFMYPRQKAYYGYFQDDWKIRPNLTLNLGIRYEVVRPIVDQLDIFNVFRPGAQSQKFPLAPQGMLFAGDPDPVLGTVPPGVYPTDKNNFAPRIGIAWVPRSENAFLKRLLGSGKTSIRTGWGVFYDQKYGFTFTQYGYNPPFTYSESLASTQIYTNGGSFANPYGTLTNNWPVDVNDRKFPTAPQMQPFDPGFRTSYTYQYNFTIQRELPKKLLLEMAYIGSDSFKMERQRQLNLSPVGPGSTLANVFTRRTYQTLGNIYSHESTGRANYNSMQIRLTRRFMKGLTFDGSYTFSKSMDNATSPQTSQLASTNQFYWARSNTDRNHNFVVSYTYDLPTTQRYGVFNRLINGWRIGGITSFRSGLPLDFRQNVNTLLDGSTVGGYGNPDVVGPWKTFDPRQYQCFTVQGSYQCGNYFFDPTALAPVPTPTDYTQARRGNLGRNTFNGPIMNSWQLSIVKQTTIRETHQFEVRADINNLFNHAQFGFPQYYVSSYTVLGKELYDFGGRNIQISARYTF